MFYATGLFTLGWLHIARLMSLRVVLVILHSWMDLDYVIELDPPLIRWGSVWTSTLQSGLILVVVGAAVRH